MHINMFIIVVLEYGHESKYSYRSWLWRVWLGESWSWRGRIIHQIERDDTLLEMWSQEQIPPTSGGDDGGTCSSQNSSVSGSTATKRIKATTSPAWEYMDVQWEVGPDSKRKKMAKYKFCSKFLSANPSYGTWHIKIHVENCKRKYLGGKDLMQSHFQFQMDGSISIGTYDPMVARKSLGRLIATADLPINFSDNSFCEDHLEDHIVYNLKNVSRITIRSDIIAYYNNALISEIGSCNFCIALTLGVSVGRVRSASPNFLSQSNIIDL